MRTSTRVLCLAVAGLLWPPGPAAHAGSQGTFRYGEGLMRESGAYVFEDKAVNGCYGMISASTQGMGDVLLGRLRGTVVPPVAGAQGNPNLVLALLDPPERPGGPRWVGLPIGQTDSQVIQAFQSGEPPALGVLDPPTVAGKIELRPPQQGSRKRYGTVKFMLVYVQDQGNWDPVRLEVPCVFEPDDDRPAPVADGGPSASPPGEGWDLTLEAELDQDGKPPVLLRRRTAFVRKEAAGWTLVFKGSGEDTTPHRCYVDEDRQTVKIRCRYKKECHAQMR